MLASDYVIEHDCLAELCIAIVRRAEEDIALTVRRPDDGIYTVEDLRYYQQDARRFLAEVKERALTLNDSVAAVLLTVVERHPEAATQLALVDAAPEEEEDDEPTKHCPRCGQDKVYSDFKWIRKLVNGKEYWGFDSYCNECRRAHVSAHRDEWNAKKREMRAAAAMARKVAHA